MKMIEVRIFGQFLGASKTLNTDRRFTPKKIWVLGLGSSPVPNPNPKTWKNQNQTKTQKIGTQPKPKTPTFLGFENIKN